MAGLATDAARGLYVDPAAGKMRFGEFAATWLDGLGHLKASTAERYREVAKRHVIPKWGGWQLGKVAHSDVTAWVSALLAEGLSPGSVRKVYLVASMIFDAAVKDGRIGRNPAKGVRLPRQPRRVPRFLSGPEVQELVAMAGPDGLSIAVLALTGLRFGEFAALRVHRLDAARSRLTVAESVSVVGSTLVWTTPKTHRTRSVPVAPGLMSHLVEVARGRDRDDLLFTSPNGGPIRLNNWRRRVFEPACAAAGLRGVTPHDLRHTAASLAVASGANVKAVQQMLGHASAAMTLDIYAGLFEDDLDAVGRSLDRHVPQMRHNGPIGAIEAVTPGAPDGL